MSTATIPLARPRTKLIFVGFGRDAGATKQLSLGTQASEGKKSEGTLRSVKLESLTIQAGQRFVLVPVAQREGVNPNTGKEFNDAPYRLAVEVPEEFDISALGEAIEVSAEAPV